MKLSYPENHGGNENKRCVDMKNESEKIIEERARAYADAPCEWDCENCSTGRMGCRFYNDKESFKDGILDEMRRNYNNKKHENK